MSEDDQDKSDIDEKDDEKDDEIKLRLEKICEETTKNNNLIKELQKTKGSSTPRSDASSLTYDIGDDKSCCNSLSCMGCACKKEKKIKKIKVKYEEPVYTDKDDPNIPKNIWTKQRKHHFQ